MFSVYRRLFTIVIFTNLTVFIALLITTHGKEKFVAYQDLVTAASANLLVAILVRNEHVVNLLFLAACSVPYRSPLFLRRMCAKVYSYGGIHSGCGIASAVWYLVFSGVLTRRFIRGELESPAILPITYVVLILLLSIIVFAHPSIRSTMHNHFEVVHRFGGWTAVGLFWAQTIVMAATDGSKGQRTSAQVLLATPSFWFLIIITICIIYPWARLRSRKFRMEPMSDHAVRLYFDYTIVEPCMGVRLSDDPLKETHAFAAIPNPDGKVGFSVFISNAGDWTNRIIQKPPPQLWTRGVPMYGVVRVASLFSPVVIVTTGSGVGPCLSLFRGWPKLPCRVLWSTRSPYVTYGQEVIDSVLRADPKALIIDTQKVGRLDMVKLTYDLYKDAGAEAVVVISNPKLTRKVVYGMESRGIPAFGVIWDS